jgi:hypothetical protein
VSIAICVALVVGEEDLLEAWLVASDAHDLELRGCLDKGVDGALHLKATYVSVEMNVTYPKQTLERVSWYRS